MHKPEHKSAFVKLKRVHTIQRRSCREAGRVPRAPPSTRGLHGGLVDNVDVACCSRPAPFGSAFADYNRKSRFGLRFLRAFCS